MRTITVRLRVLGWLGLLATVAVAGCAAISTSSPAAPGHSRSASPAPATAVAVSAPAGTGGVRKLPVSRDVRNELTVAYVNSRGISLSDVAGTIPGSVHYAYDPATDTYWAEADFLPSRTASQKVLVGFQDGGSIGLFARAARSSWQVQLGGEPVVCAEVPFFPPAVLMAWSLPADTAAFGCRVRPVRQVSSETFAVTISIPGGGWQPTPNLGPDRFGYDGPSGWVQLNAMVEPKGLHYACTVAAAGNVLNPYGLHPQIVYRSIDGRQGCLIFPSSDAPRQSHRTGYPTFQNSAALVEYRQPVSAGSGCLSPTGQHCLYSLLIIYADPAHLTAIADSVQLHH
jgi:hypothetical protein